MKQEQTGSRKKPNDSKGKRGPKPETLKIEGDWKDGIERALKKKRPESGWPKEEKEG